LNWQSLLIRETIELERRPDDRVLLWQDRRPLVFLRETQAIEGQPVTRQLCFNFDLKLSNADIQPAFIVLLHRFAESLRHAKIAPVSANLEIGQPLQVTVYPDRQVELAHFAPDGQRLATLRVPEATNLRAPLEPGFLTVRQGDELLLNAALHFADTREADFSQCGSSDVIEASSELAMTQHTRPDPYWRMVLLVLVAALIFSWKPSAPSPLPT
jgi:hypothetical protein